MHSQRLRDTNDGKQSMQERWKGTIMNLKLTIVALLGFGVLSASAANASGFSQFMRHSNVYAGVNNGGGPYGGGPYGYNPYFNPPRPGCCCPPTPVLYYQRPPAPCCVPAWPPIPCDDFYPPVIPQAAGWNQFGNSGYSPNQFGNQFPPQNARRQNVSASDDQQNGTP